VTAAPNLLPALSDSIWISAEQVMHLTRWTDRWLRKKVALGSIVSRDSINNAKRTKEYLLSSLPADAQGRHLGPSITTAPRTQLMTLPAPLFAVPQATEPERNQLTDPDDIAQANERYEILRPILEFQKDPHRFASICVDGKPVDSEARLQIWIAEQHNINPRTLRRYKQRYMEGGWAALADRVRSDRGQSRWFAKYPNAAMLAAYVYLEQRQSVSVAWEAIKRDHLMLDVPADDLPSYETVRAALQSVTPSLRILAREGATKYRELCAPYISRFYTEYANQIWVSDHAIHDVEVMNDCFPEQPYGTPIRLRFTCLLDFRSRYVVGYSWAWEGSSRSIGTAMRRAICTYGPPEGFYCDNGKDYLKVAKGAVPAWLRERGTADPEWYRQELVDLDRIGLMARCGIAVTHCIVRHPQSKHVERFFRTMHERFDRRWPTYTGGDPSRRPDLTEAAMAEHRRLMRHGQVERSSHPRASLFIACFRAWLDEYHHTPHSGKGMDGRCPADVFEQEANPAQKPIPEPHLLATMLADRKSCLVQEGSVTINKRRYVGYDAESYGSLHQRNRTQVIVAYDSNDPEAVAVLDEQGHFITMAQAEPFLAQSNAASGEAIKASMQARRHLEKQDRRALRGLTLAARRIGATSEVEHLIERAELMPALEGVLTHRPLSAAVPTAAMSQPSMGSGDIAEMLMEQIRGE
jgi:putative transposase